MTLLFDDATASNGRLKAIHIKHTSIFTSLNRVQWGKSNFIYATETLLTALKSRVSAFLSHSTSSSNNKP